MPLRASGRDVPHDRTRGNRDRRRSTRILGVLVSASALLAAGCGSPSHTATATAPQATSSASSASVPTPSATPEPTSSVETSYQIFARVNATQSVNSAFGNAQLVITRSGDVLSSWTPAGEPLGARQFVATEDACVGLGAYSMTLATDANGVTSLFQLTKVDHPAQGVNPATSDISLTAFSSALEQEWTVPIGTVQTDDRNCVGEVSATSDGAWVTFRAGNENSDAPQYYYGWVSVSTHQVKTNPDPVRAVAERILQSTCLGSPCNDVRYTVINPVTGTAHSVSHSYGANDHNQAGGILDVRENHPDSTAAYGTHSLLLRDGKTVYLLDLDSFVVTQGAAEDTAGESHLMFDPESGFAAMYGSVFQIAPKITRLWDFTAQMTFCSLGRGVVVVAVNHQLAELDASTGKQLAFTADYTECPAYTFGRFGWYADGTIMAILPDAVAPSASSSS